MTRELLLSLDATGNCRAAVLRDGRLEGEVVRGREEHPVGSIYKGRVVNVEPAIQACFVDYGVGRNGFLHVSDVEPEYYRHLQPRRPDEDEERGRPQPKPPIQDVLRRGQEVLVQVIKEGVGGKGATLSTYLSLASRYLVLMPGLGRIGVSRKIESDEDRQRLRDTIASLRLPAGLGFVVRTAALGRGAGELQHDVDYLERVWAAAAERVRTCRPPAEVYREGVVATAFRLLFTEDLDAVHVNSPEAFERAREVVTLYHPGLAGRVRLDEGPGTFFEQYDVENPSNPSGDAL
jgi:ribonuclease E